MVEWWGERIEYRERLRKQDNNISKQKKKK